MIEITKPTFVGCANGKNTLSFYQTVAYSFWEEDHENKKSGHLDSDDGTHGFNACGMQQVGSGAAFHKRRENENVAGQQGQSGWRKHEKEARYEAIKVFLLETDEEVQIADGEYLIVNEDGSVQVFLSETGKDELTETEAT